jgi:hypothetical protein
MTASEIKISETEDAKREEKGARGYYNEISLRDIFTRLAALFFFISLLVYKTNSTTFFDNPGNTRTVQGERQQATGVEYAQVKEAVAVSSETQPAIKRGFRGKLTGDRIQLLWVAPNGIDSSSFIINHEARQWLFGK